MSFTPPGTIPRRALLHVGSVMALGALSPAYVGCGGSATSLPNSESFPEVYDEAYLLDSGGVTRRVVTLSKPVGASEAGYDYLTGANFSISPGGDIYGTAYLRSPEGVLSGSVVLRWEASGKFMEIYGEDAERRLFGSRVSFSPEGTPFALGFNEGENVLYYRPLHGGSQVDDVPIRAGKFSTGGYQLQTDDAGNFYALGTEDATRHAASRTSPEPREIFVRKFSPAGSELAFVRVNGNEFITSLAVGGDGNLYVVTGGAMRVFRRTR
ncbi:MAG: hypothetical protein H7145_13300 [Akkermansiaceae bacterium]|nr:hypothetical protein [Armatimonadota bacterium]